MWLDTVGAAALPLTAVRGEGCRIQDADGRWYWDFYGGHAVTLLGQGHPRWVEALARQARELSFFTTLAPVPVRSQAARALCGVTGYDRAWFVNSGAEANEAALKIVRKATGRTRIISFQGGFHGRSMGALGATWRYRDQHSPAHGDTVFVPYDDLDALDAVLDDEVAGVIVEPVQGIAGVRVPSAGFLGGVLERAHAVGALLIADEVQCGMGRMGTWLAQDLSQLRADVTTLGKGLGGGFPVSAVLLDAPLAATVLPGEHGSTFGGAPLACAAVVETIAIVREEQLLARAQQLGRWMHQELSIPGLCRVRGAGAWAGLVLEQPAKPVAAALLEQGMLAGTSSDPQVLRLAPAATMPQEAVVQMGQALRVALDRGRAVCT